MSAETHEPEMYPGKQHTTQGRTQKIQEQENVTISFSPQEMSYHISISDKVHHPLKKPFFPCIHIPKFTSNKRNFAILQLVQIHLGL